MTVNVLVLNFNGRDLLKKYLPSLEKALVRSRFACRLGVVDNCSSDDSINILRREFPKVTIYPVTENRVLCSYNEVALQVTDDIVLLMNNDLEVDEAFIDPLVKPFAEDRNVFFVTPRCLSMKDGSYEGNKTYATMRYGIFWSSAIFPGHEKFKDKAGFTAQGGFGAFDRKKFLRLGGYDDLYLPGRLEDADICYRAFQKGWKCLYEPASIVYHEGGVSFHKAFGVKKTLVINWRNTFLFMWKNLNDKLTVLRHVFWLPWRLLGSLVLMKPELFLGFCAALPLWKEARKRRRRLKKEGSLGIVPDRLILNRV